MGFPNGEYVKIEHILKSDLDTKNLISYSFFNSTFGKILVASIPQGVCYVGFAISIDCALQELFKRFPNDIFRRRKTKYHEQVKKLFAGKWEKGKKIVLFLRGTEFQLKVWDALLKIPTGTLTTYSKIAKSIGYSNAQRAVGTAIGKNPILYIIPCHRVIAQNGKLGGFYWGIEKKIELLNVENAGYLHFVS
ncbi:MAG: methylated-DNA--[protein]-cysteine S-methyltransferase [Bacteroidales bacterium]|jgi:AraC family transcriptional regulator of adaptative response/methylated-DNA-[protein]-cysteine methyltransferase|nr:methylated-DNA--[protein]-cysteine S-methyltransferase [Bacteroidales bacterium]